MKTYRSARDLVADVEAVLRHPHNIKDQPHFGASYSLHQPSYTAPLERVTNLLVNGRHYFWVGIFLVIGNHVVRQAFSGPMPPFQSFELGKGNVGASAERGVTKVVLDVKTDPAYGMSFRETRSAIVIPIKIGGRVLGVIDAKSDKSRALGPKDRVLLENVAAVCARFFLGKGKYVLRHARQEWQKSVSDKAAPRIPGRSARAAADSR